MYCSCSGEAVPWTRPCPAVPVVPRLGCADRPPSVLRPTGVDLFPQLGTLEPATEEGTEFMPDNIAQDVLDAQNLQRAIRLRVRGAHWSEIAAECNFTSPAAALRAVGEAMASATARAKETADQMRDTANLRLEHLLKSTLDMLDADAPTQYDADGNELTPDDRAVKLRAVDEARRLVTDLAKLNGVDKPSKDADSDDVQTVRIVGLDPRDLV